MDRPDWVLHKAEIHRIYITENKTLEELCRFMATTHGFKKTGHQYQRQLRRWRFKKYRMGAKKWIYVKRQIEKRNKLKKASEVLIDNIRCPPDVVQAEVRRQGFETAAEIYSTAPSPKAPDGVIVCTPGSATPQLRPSSLPWFTFLQPSLLDFQIDCRPLRVSPPQLYLSPSGEKNRYLRFLRTNIAIRLSSILKGNVAGCVLATPSSSLMATALSLIMPEEYQGQNMHLSDSLCSMRDEVDFTGVLHVATFLLSNNLLERKTGTSGNGLRVEDKMVMAIFYLFGLYTSQNMRGFLSMPGATAHAISLRFWRSALRAHDLEAVQSLLKAGINPDTTILFDNCPLRPLVLATQCENNIVALEMSRSLFSYNTCSNDPQALESALYHATKSQNKELMELLLLKGAYVSGSTLRAAIYLRIPDLLKILLAADGNVNKRCDSHGSLGNSYSVLGIAVKRNDVPLTRSLLALGAKVDAHQQVYFSRNILGKWQSTTLGLAALGEDSSIIDLLLAAGADVNYKTLDRYYVPPLVLAVENGRDEVTERLLQAGADMDLGDEIRNFTLVQQDLATKNQKLAKFLMENGASLDAKFMEDHHSSMLMRKVREDDLETVTHLISCGARVNDIYTEIPDTVLAAAVFQGNCEILNVLLRAGAVNIGKELICIGNLKMASYLEKRGMLSKILQSNGQHILVNAIRSGDTSLVDFLLDHGVDQQRGDVGRQASWYVDERRMYQMVENDGPDIAGIPNTPLGEATHQGNLRLAKVLVSRGASITDFELSDAVRWCCYPANFAFLELFLHALDGRACEAPNSYASALLYGIPFTVADRLWKAGLDERGKVIIPTRNAVLCERPTSIAHRKKPLSLSVLDLAAILDHTFFSALLENGKWDRPDKGQTLIICIDGECKFLVRELLEAGADVNHEIKMGVDYVTPLVTAVQLQNISIIHKLLTAGADVHWTPPETSSNEDFTILQHAVRTGNKEIVDILIQAGADVNAPASRRSGKSALQRAVYDGNMELVDTLLVAGANVNQEPAEDRGGTALQFASMQGYIGIARKLLAEGAEVDAPKARNRGKTALEGAAEYGRIDMLQLLLNEGASVHGAGREQYIRAVHLAECRTHYAAAELLKNFGGWNEEDARPVI